MSRGGRTPAGARWLLALAALLMAGPGAQAETGFGLQPVGTTSPAQAVTVTATAAGSVSQVEVLTLGVEGLDFAPGGGASTCASAHLTPGATCTESVTFTPGFPGLRLGAVVLLDGGSQVLGTAYLAGTGSGGLGVLVPGNMFTVAGIYRTWTSTQDGIPATQANLWQPASVTLDGAGNLYIADSAHNKIRKVTAATGLISTVAGNGAATYAGDGKLAIDASLSAPSGLTIDGAGNLYIADTGNSVIRKVTAATGIITTVAGDGTPGDKGDNGPATSASLNGPWGITLDTGGNLYIADTANQRIRKVEISTGIITTVAGDGFQGAGGLGGYAGDNGPAISAELSLPYAVAFDAVGNMFIPDSANNVIRRVDSTGIITSYAGTGNPGFGGDSGPAAQAELHQPEGVAVDPAGNLYIADTQNSAIRKVSSAAPNNILTIAINGKGTTLAPGSTTPAPVVLYAPTGMVLDGDGNLFVADYYYMLVEEVQSNLTILNYIATPVRQGDKSAPQDATVENDGNTPLDLTAINPVKNAAINAADTTCTLGAPFLPVNQECEVAAEFAPTVAGNPLFGDIDVTGATPNSPLVIELIGDATAVNSTTVALISSLNPSDFGRAVTFTATVTTGAGTGKLTGTVTFMDGAKTLGVPVNLSPTGTASFTTAALAVGSHTITAVYSGDSAHFPATSPPLTQVVNEATAVQLTSSANPSQVGQNVTFTATVKTPAGGGIVPDGSVVFTDGVNNLATVPLNAAGVATYSTAALANGLHVITAAYGGDPANYILASQATLRQEVQAPTTTAVTSNNNPSIFGTQVTFTATVTPSGAVAPVGVVNFLDGANKIGAGNVGANGEATFTTAALIVGSHSITAAYQGSADDGASTSAPITQVVNLAQTETTLKAVPNPGIAGLPVALTATVKPAQGVAIPAGNVTFTDGAVNLGTAALGANGTATINPSFAQGNHSIVATYAGDANDSGSASPPLELTINLATTEVAVTATPNPAVVLSPVIMTAVVKGNGAKATGNVSFLADGKQIGTGQLDATGTAMLNYAGLAVGSHTITADYAGDKFNAPADSPSITEVVQAIPTVTDLGTSAPGVTQVTLVAVVFGTTGPTPTGTVSFHNGKAVIGTSQLDSSGVATLTPNLPNGSYSIVAVYEGDMLHSPSSSKPVTISGTAAGFNLTVTPSSLTIPTKENASVTVDISSNSGFTDTIELGCLSVPVAVTCHFSSFNVALAANAKQNVKLTIDTNYPLSGGGTTAMNAPPGNPGLEMAGLFLPFSALFGWLFWRLRKRYGAILTAALVLSLCGAATLVTGCGGFTQISAKPGKYVIQVTGIGANSNITHYQNLTLNITQ